ncbi:MAG: ABC transporter substrate-binding protein [Rhodospirillales bacterium]|jgi:NitT/TauT family transport system substrate-binding protein|nr:ABC transporter substrate-binding protein [Rhodospirillales bacterium]
MLPRRAAFAAPLLLLAAAPGAAAAERVVFGLDWKAEAEYGGFYQALATGIYARHGLDVRIAQGGPQLNHVQLLLAGRQQFDLAGGRAVEFARHDLPFVAIAAIFQKDPSVLIAHPGTGVRGFADLKGRPIEVAADVRAGWWRFLAAKYGYSDSQIRPYTFNLAAFLANKRMVQEGYLGSEPFLIEQQAHFKPVVLPIAEAGYQGYGNVIATSRRLIAENPGLVQRFVDASIAGWHSYLHDDPAPADALIRKANPDMPQDLIDYGRKVMREYGIVESGDAARLGIGAMTDARWQAYYDGMAAVGVYPKGIDIRKGYTLQFVDRGAGRFVDRRAGGGGKG